MKYEPGRMGVAEGIALVSILTFARAFLTAAVGNMDENAGLGWLVSLTSGLPPFILLWGMIVIVRRLPGDLVGISAQLLGRKAAWLIGLFYAGLFLTNGTLLIRQFSENTLLAALPSMDFNLVVGSYALVAAVLLLFEVEAVARSAYIILPFGVLGLLLVMAMLIPYYNIYNLAPWMGRGLGELGMSSLQAAGLNVGVVALVILAPCFQRPRTLQAVAVFGYGGCLVVKTLALLVFALVFGVQVGREKVLPFFEMARLVYINRYLQHFEALFIVLWVLVGLFAIVISLYLSLYLITRLLNLPSPRPLVFLISLAAAQLATLPGDIDTTVQLDTQLIHTYFNIGVYGIPGLLIAAYFVKRKKGKEKSCATG